MDYISLDWEETNFGILVIGKNRKDLSGNWAMWAKFIYCNRGSPRYSGQVIMNTFDKN